MNVLLYVNFMLTWLSWQNDENFRLEV